MKFSKYNIFVETDNGIALYNSLNTNCVNIHKKEEVDKFMNLVKTGDINPSDQMVKELYKRKYIVDDDVDEYKQAQEDLEQYYAQRDRVLNIMLYVTENCNFRCVYCFEEHLNKNFSTENWDALYKYIEKSLADNLYDCVSMSFFGGEPLLEKTAILDFLDRLEILRERHPNVIFSHHITTNGYLLTPALYDKLTERNVFRYMITVDGFAEAHNETRPLAGGQGTWDAIIANLKYINTKKDAVCIIVRVNVNTVNAKDMKEFIDWVIKTFNQDKFVMNIDVAGDLSGYEVDKKYAKDYGDKDVQEILEKYVKTTQDMSLLSKYAFNCVRVGKGHFTISVDGQITKCEDAFTGRCPSVGYLSKEGEFIFNENYKKWTEGFETEYCKDCVVYPLCGGRRCPDKKVNYPDERADCLYIDKLINPDDGLEFMIKKALKDRFSSNNNS